MRRFASLQTLLIYGLSGPIIALNIWLMSVLFHFFQNPLTILSISAILAFLLNYPVKLFANIRIRRTQAVIIVLILTLTLFIVLGVTLVPMLIDQTIQLLNKIPDWLATSQANFDNLEMLAKQRRLSIDLKLVTNQINANIQNLVQGCRICGNAIISNTQCHISHCSRLLYVNIWRSRLDWINQSFTIKYWYPL
jgi:predicted PurR-regulated permease PerM